MQERSQQRYAAILRSAGELIDTDGVDRLTMEAVAKRADTSIGSVYRFFTNRDELLLALARDLAGAALVHYADLHSEANAARDVRDHITEYLDSCEQFVLENPGMLGFMAASAHVDTRAKQIFTAESEWHARIEGYVGMRAPHLSRARRRSVARMLMRVTEAGLEFAFEAPPKERRARLDELGEVLVAYYESL